MLSSRIQQPSRPPANIRRTALSGGIDAQEESAILIELPHKPGILKHISDNLTREDIDIYHIYATALDRNDTCLLVLHTADDEHAIPVLNRMPVVAGAEQ